MPDIYSTPEQFGVTLIGEIDWYAGNGYEWNMTVVFRDAKGHLYWGDDAGCSCYPPFYKLESLEDFETGTMMDLSNHIAEIRAERLAINSDDESYLDGEIAEVMKRVVGF